MDDLCVTKSMTLFEWIDLAASLGVDGVEMYPGFFESFEPEYLDRVSEHLAMRKLEAPMMCASPDFHAA
jgi:sugar phosphate isomerase/epimerase